METATRNETTWNKVMNLIKQGYLVEIPEWIYNDMLNNMPPILMDYGGYINSEPYRFSPKENADVYFCGIKRDNKFYGCHATVKQYKSLEPLKRVFKHLN